MAILAGFRKVKPDAQYKGAAISHIAVDTKGRFHLMPVSAPNDAVAILENCSHAEPGKDNSDVYWLWENMLPALRSCQ